MVGKRRELRILIVNIRMKKVVRRNPQVAADVAGAVGKGKGVAGAVGRGRGVEKGVAKSLMLRPKQVGVLPRQKVEKNRRCHQKHAVPRKQSRKSPRQKK